MSWYVANNKGEIAAYNMYELTAKILAEELQKKEPDAGWKAMNAEEEERNEAL